MPHPEMRGKVDLTRTLHLIFNLKLLKKRVLTIFIGFLKKKCVVIFLKRGEYNLFNYRQCMNLIIIYLITTFIFKKVKLVILILNLKIIQIDFKKTNMIFYLITNGVTVNFILQNNVYFFKSKNEILYNFNYLDPIKLILKFDITFYLIIRFQRNNPNMLIMLP